MQGRRQVLHDIAVIPERTPSLVTVAASDAHAQHTSREFSPVVAQDINLTCPCTQHVQCRPPPNMWVGGTPERCLSGCGAGRAEWCHNLKCAVLRCPADAKTLINYRRWPARWSLASPTRSCGAAGSCALPSQCEAGGPCESVSTGGVPRPSARGIKDLSASLCVGGRSRGAGRTPHLQPIDTPMLDITIQLCGADGAELRAPIKGPCDWPSKVLEVAKAQPNEQRRVHGEFRIRACLRRDKCAIGSNQSRPAER